MPRFRNPAIVDQLLRVAGDGCAKLPTFHGQTLRMLIDKGADLRREAFLMACFGRYLKFFVDPDLRDDRGGRFEPFEPGLTEDDIARIRASEPAAVLGIRALANLGLAEHGAFRVLFDRYARSIAESGTKSALTETLEENANGGGAA